MEPREVLQENLALIDSIVDRISRRARLYGPDAEDFAASVKLALVEDDYAILRRFEGRASLSTYLTIVIERLLAAERIHARGRWHASTEAVRLGAGAMLLESLVVRDRRTLDEALPLVRAADPAITRQSAEDLLRRFPERKPRPMTTDLDSVPADALRANAAPVAFEARQLSERAARIVRDTLAVLTAEDRTILRFRFGAGLSIADIARMTRLPQRPLYRRIESLLQRLRDALRREGLDGAAVEEIIETSAAEEFDFGLMENKPIRQTNQHMERS